MITEQATNVLVLPVEAVAGSQGKGKVDVVMPDGQRQTRDVVLGLTDGKVIEIKSGLTGDETSPSPGRTCRRRPGRRQNAARRRRGYEVTPLIQLTGITKTLGAEAAAHRSSPAST